MNSALEAFTTEMKSQEAWDDVTIVMVSEFARTLAGNTGENNISNRKPHSFIFIILTVLFNILF